MLKYTDITQNTNLNGYGDNGQRSLKLWQLLHTYWLPNTYENWQEYVVSVMLISVNIKLTCEWHNAIKLNYKNNRTHVIVVLRVPSTIHDTWMSSTDVTWLTAHSGISLLHNCTKIQYLYYSNCSMCPPPAAMQFSARIKRDWVAEAIMSGWLRMSLQKYDRAVLLVNRP